MTITSNTASALPIVDDETSSGLTFELVDGHIGVLTLNRPELLNAISWELYNALATAFYRISARNDIRVVVLQGAGRAFCAGGDVRFMRQQFDGEIPLQDVQKLALRYMTELLNLPQPTIAVVHGPAVGFGCTTALACDIVFAGDRARFADPHLRIGLVAGDGAAVLWPLLVGPARAKQYLLTGDSIDAAKAERIGLVNEVYPSDEVHEHAMTLARRLAAAPVEATRATKALVNHVIRTLGEGALRAGLQMELVSQLSEEHRVAVEQFLAGGRPGY